MAVKNCINPVEIELLQCHLDEIASTCHALRGAGFHLADGDAAVILGSVVVALAEKAGCRADAALKLIGRAQFMGDWKDWALSPVEDEIRKKLADGEASHG